jgi:hypothetical protein
MHNYSIDSDERIGTVTHVVIYLTVVVLAIHLALRHLMLRNEAAGEVMYEFIATPVFFYLFMTWFDANLWKRRIYTWELSKTPIFAGLWEGSVAWSSPLDDAKVTVEKCQVRIYQTWLKMQIRFESATGMDSKSTVAFIDGIRNEFATLLYCYERSHPLENQHYSGTCKLDYVSPDELRGNFYAGSRSEHCGTLGLLRVCQFSERFPLPSPCVEETQPHEQLRREHLVPDSGSPINNAIQLEAVLPGSVEPPK